MQLLPQGVVSCTRYDTWYFIFSVLLGRHHEKGCVSITSRIVAVVVVVCSSLSREEPGAREARAVAGALLIDGLSAVGLRYFSTKPVWHRPHFERRVFFFADPEKKKKSLDSLNNTTSG